MFAHYYYVCTVSPGFADDPPSTITTRQGMGWIWAKTRESRRDVQWSDELNLSVPKYNKCKRCGIQRPEVCVQVRTFYEYTRVLRIVSFF